MISFLNQDSSVLKLGLDCLPEKLDFKVSTLTFMKITNIAKVNNTCSF